MSEELKPCPFCGGHYFETLAPFYVFVCCVECGTEGPIRDTEAEAIKAWNTRAGDKS